MATEMRAEHAGGAGPAATAELARQRDAGLSTGLPKASMQPLVMEGGEESSTAGASSSSSREVRKGMSMKSAIFNLTNTIIGSGTLTMPYAFAQCGILGANLIAVVMICVTGYSAHLLLNASANCRRGRAAHGPRNFQQLGAATSGPKAAAFAMATFIVGGLGTLTGYLIFIGRLLTQVLNLSEDDAWKPIVAVTVCLVLPLSWSRRIDGLKYISFLALLAILYVVVMFCAFAGKVGEFHDKDNDKYEDVEMLRWTKHSINTVSLMIGAYCVHNTALPICDEMEGRSPRRAVLAIVISMLVAFAVYEALGLSAYYLLGGNVDGNCLLGLDAGFVKANPWSKWPTQVAKVTMSFLLSASAPLAIWPFRSAVCSMILCGANEEPSALVFRSVTVVSLAIVAVLAYFIPDVTVPLGLVNSLAGGSMVFLMPGYFYLGSLEESARLLRIHTGPMLMIFMGVIVCVLGFILELQSVIDKFSSKHHDGQ